MRDNANLELLLKELLDSNGKILEQLSNLDGKNDRWLDVSEACMWLKCSTRTLQKYRDEGMLPFSQIAAKIYFRESDLQSFLNRHNTSPNEG